MAGIAESYKKVFENKQANIWLAVTAFLWTVLSFAYDILIGKPDTIKQNPFDLIFNIIVGVYSLQFLHNAIQNVNNGILPGIKEIKPKIILDVIKLNIVWGCYAAVVIILAVVSFLLAHYMVIPIIISAMLLFVSAFIYYIYLAYAENLDSRGLLNIKLLFKFIKPAIKPLYKKVIIFILFTLAVMAAYILVYTAAGLTGIDKIGNLGDDCYVMDVIMNTFTAYFIIITWYFAFPYSLINSYNRDIRPLIRKDEINGTDA